MGHKFSTRVRRRKHFRQKTLNNLALFFIVLIPVYPAFGLYMQNYTGVIVRGQYDRSTILASYDWGSGDDTADLNWEPEGQDITPETTLIEPTSSEPELVQPVSPVPTQTLPSPDPKRSLYVAHTVVSGDTLSTIAQKYTISLATLRTINNLTSDILSINQKIIIPRINGVNYIVQKGDSLSTIAQKYGIRDIDTIIIANDMRRNAPLRIGGKLLLPNPTKDPQKKPVIVATVPPIVSKNTPQKQNTVIPPTKTSSTPTSVKKDPQVISYGDYSLALKVSKGCRGFVWGNCTCFVAKYKNVTWRGNAKDWIKNAKKQNIPTGNDPRPGAIIVYHGPGFPPAYGHVGIVMEVEEDYMIIKDMNYRALNEVTTRRENFANPAIIGYIYVD